MGNAAAIMALSSLVCFFHDCIMRMCCYLLRRLGFIVVVLEHLQNLTHPIILLCHSLCSARFVCIYHATSIESAILDLVVFVSSHRHRLKQFFNSNDNVNPNLSASCVCESSFFQMIFTFALFPFNVYFNRILE